MSWFNPVDTQRAKEMFVRRQQRKLIASVQTAMAMLMAFFLSGCDGVNAKIVLFFWLVLGPLAFEILIVLRPQCFPASFYAGLRASPLLFGLGLMFPFWLVGLAVMKVVA